jgi:anti-anti-sigma factor
MALKVETQIAENDLSSVAKAALSSATKVRSCRQRVRQLLTGTPKIVVNLDGVDHIDSGGIGILVGILVSAKNHGGEPSWSRLVST